MLCRYSTYEVTDAEKIFLEKHPSGQPIAIGSTQLVRALREGSAVRLRTEKEINFEITNQQCKYEF